jgi:hypothetical protein
MVERKLVNAGEFGKIKGLVAEAVGMAAGL